MLPLETARARVLDKVAKLSPLPPERVPVADALGRALSEDLIAGADLPPFTSSTMDGYALRALDAGRPGARLEVAFEVFAGKPALLGLKGGSCCRIFTGAPLPEGADAVEMQEQVRRQGPFAVFARAIRAGQNLRRKGSDLSRGEVALRAGALLDPSALGLAAALGLRTLSVPRRPRVAILPTGDELVPPGSPLPVGAIRESNGRALSAATREAGGEPLLFEPARDRPGSLSRALRLARGADVLLTVGGVSVGAKDLVRQALTDSGALLAFWRVAVQPGKPFTFGIWEHTAVFGLPGNPASAYVAFELFVRPALRRLAGLVGDGRIHGHVRLAIAWEKAAGRTQCLRVRLGKARGTGHPWATPLWTQRSGDLNSLVGADALALLDAKRTHFRRGAVVPALYLRAPEALESFRHDP